MSVDPNPRAHVASTTDFYALLGVPADFSAPDALRRAHRKGSLRYHPDKAVGRDATEAEKTAARDRWDLFVVAGKVLEDGGLRAQYDAARAARAQRAARDAAHGAHRQAMIDRLERREQDGRDSARAVDAAEAERRRLADLGRQMVEEAKAKKRAEQDDEDAAVQAESRRRDGGAVAAAPDDQVPQSDLIVKVRFPAGAPVTAAHLETIFSAFGEVDSAVLGKVKEERVEGGSREKRALGRGFVQFKHRLGASDAVIDWKEERERVAGKGWEDIVDVAWFSKTPPAWAQAEMESRSRHDTPVRDVPVPASAPSSVLAPSTTTMLLDDDRPQSPETAGPLTTAAPKRATTSAFDGQGQGQGQGDAAQVSAHPPFKSYLAVKNGQTNKPTNVAAGRDWVRAKLREARLRETVGS